jgi:hypothetical protein
MSYLYEHYGVLTFMKHMGMSIVGPKATPKGGTDMLEFVPGGFVTTSLSFPGPLSCLYGKKHS